MFVYYLTVAIIDSYTVKLQAVYSSHSVFEPVIYISIFS